MLPLLSFYVCTYVCIYLCIYVCIQFSALSDLYLYGTVSAKTGLLLVYKLSVTSYVSVAMFMCTLLASVPIGGRRTVSRNFPQAIKV